MIMLIAVGIYFLVAAAWYAHRHGTTALIKFMFGGDENE